MTSKLTREQAEDTIEGLEGLIGRGVRSVYLDMAITGMRQLMAALDSEPVAECQHQWRFGGANALQNQKQCVMCGRVELDTQPAHEAKMEAILADHETLNTITVKLRAVGLTKKEFHVVNSLISMVKTGEMVLLSKVRMEFKRYQEFVNRTQHKRGLESRND